MACQGSITGLSRRLRLRLAAHLGCQRIELRNGPFLSFTFDDFPRSAWTVGGTILREAGLFGTYYAAMSQCGAFTEAGENFHPEDLCNLLEEGHELASHGFAHLSGLDVSAEVFAADVRRGIAELRAIAGEGVSTNFAYPFGEATLSAKLAIARDLRSCRSIRNGINGPIADLSFLRANELFGGLEQLIGARRLIEACRLQAGWLIFYTHDVQHNHSRYGCRPELLEGIVSTALENGIQVLPVSGVLDALVLKQRAK